MPSLPLVHDALTLPSREFADRLFAACPEVRPCARMVGPHEGGSFELLVELPSPTGDPEREVYLWMEQGEPSLGLGPQWHTHAGLWSGDERGVLAGWTELIALLRAILADQLVLWGEVGSETAGFRHVLDLRDPEALADTLTCRYAPLRLRIRSWGGTADAEVGLEDVAL
jgi:hypothetical protein